MGFKKMDTNIGFADFALASSLKHNRSLKLMEKLDEAIDWTRVETILFSHYTVGTSGEGADAYSPLLLFKRPLSYSKSMRTFSPILMCLNSYCNNRHPF